MFNTLQLSKTNPTPLYIQLATQLAQLIQDNTLSLGTKLPPIRILAKELGINRDTVVSAYNVLESQGLAKAYIGKGTYVAHTQASPSFSPTPLENPLYCTHLKFSQSFFPSSLCEAIATSLIQKEGWDVFSDTLHREQNSLRQTICSFLSTFSVHASAAQIRLTDSLENFFIELLHHYPKPGICVEAFRDLQLSSTLTGLGAKIYEVPFTSEGLNLSVLEKYLRTGTISYIIVSPNLHNPTGLTYSDANKRQLIKLATLYDCYLIEEGTYSDFLYHAPEPSPLFSHFSKERVIYLYQFSKVYLPPLSYSFVALPFQLIRPLTGRNSYSFNERFLHTYLTSTLFETTRKQLLKENKEKWLLLANALKHLPHQLSISPSLGGLSLWLKPLCLTSEDFIHALIKKRILVAPGSLFTSIESSPYIRLSFSHLTYSETQELLQILLSILC
ncbi:aminotransferase-like domain-containing protein [Sporanaerobium hydrogeniformans]|uniref:aminotransferase-like domain-containing protein n=1 Tax=Sporanaerobium hydrogeniformans TaxID=3072179 RepID=UPI0015D4E4BB|nr:PLP-dependent aminotransferase family protein [Sporanaerobium hydrogeniformans]